MNLCTRGRVNDTGQATPTNFVFASETTSEGKKTKACIVDKNLI